MDARARRAAVLVSVALAVVIGPGLAAVGPTSPAGAQPRRVVVVGDSVILGARAPMTSAFESQGWAVTFDAAVSRSTSAGLGAIESHRAQLTDSLVVSLGANDAGNTATFAGRVRAIMDATATVPHVYWVTIREVRGYYGPANQVLRDAAAGRPNVTVIDWHAATAGTTALTAGDGLHLNGAGAARMTELVTGAVIAGAASRAAPPPAAPPATVPPTTVPPTTVPATVPPTTAPTTVPTTTEARATTTTVRNVDDAAGERAAERAAAARRTRADAATGSSVDRGTVRSVGGGIGVVVGVLALGGAVLAIRSLLHSHDTQKT
jgi:lysophospholipase L1-like esterase